MTRLLLSLSFALPAAAFSQTRNSTIIIYPPAVADFFFLRVRVAETYADSTNTR